MQIPTHLFAAPGLIHRCQTAASLFLGLDYDGTLVPIATHPSDARPTQTVLSRLSQLANMPAITVAIISGRPLADLRMLTPIPGITHVGTHGLEIAPPNGEVLSLVPNAVASLVMVRIQLEATSIVAGKTGLFVENKRHAVALHYRLALPDVADAAIAQFVARVRHFQQQGAALEVVHGKKVVEVRPIGVNKGKALQVLLTPNLQKCVPLYIGDDQTDEDAFQVVNHCGGISIVVTEDAKPTTARYQLQDPEEVNRFLTCLLSLRTHAVLITRH